MPFRFTTFISRNKSNEQPISTMEQAFYRCTYLHFLDAKSSMRSSYGSCCATSELMLMTARLLKRSCAIDEQTYVLMSFSFEKLCSAEAAVTGKVTAMRKSIHRFRCSYCKWFSWRNDNIFRAVVCVGSSVRLMISWAISAPSISDSPSPAVNVFSTLV